MKSLCYESTSACILKCPYCISSDNGCLVEERYEDIINFIGKTLPERLVIGGGEPLIDPFFKDKIDLIRKKYLEVGLVPYISLSTSGACFINSEMWDFLKGRIECFDISIPTLKHDVYEKMRGFDLLDTALINARKAASLGINVRISVVMTKYNQDEIGDILSFAEEIGANSVRIGRYFPFRNANKVKDEFELEEEAVQRIISDINSGKYSPLFSKKILPPIRSLDMMNGYLNVDFTGTLFVPTISGKNVIGDVSEVDSLNLDCNLKDLQQKIFIKSKE